MIFTSKNKKKKKIKGLCTKDDRNSPYTRFFFYIQMEFRNNYSSSPPPLVPPNSVVRPRLT